MNTTTMKYSKYVLQLEKGLPPNAVVPKLKEKVDIMRERVSVQNVIGSHLIYHDDQTQGEGRHHEREGECTKQTHLYRYRQSLNIS